MDTDGRAYAAPASPDSEEHSSIDLVTLWLFLHRERNLILGVAAVVTVFATITAFLLPVQYTSTTSFIPPNLNNSSSLASALGGQLAALSAGDVLGGMKSPGDLYAGILDSHSITGELISRFNLIRIYRTKRESDAEKILRSKTTIDVDSKSTIVTVSVTAKSPQLAHDLAAAYMDALRDTNGRLALSQSSQRRLFFEQQLAIEKDNLENAEVELKKTEENSGLIAPTGQTEAEIRTIADTQAQIAARKVELAALRQSATEQNPDVIRLQSEITDLESQLTALQKGNKSGTGITIPTSKVPEAELDYVRKEREVKYHEALFEMLSKQYEAARLDEARDAPVLQVLDPASYPDVKSSPKRVLIILCGALAGLIAGCLWPFARDPIQRLRAAKSPARTH